MTPMLNPIPLPTPDPMPLPGPVWLMLTLLLLTFLLHLFAMNLTVGGTAIALFCSLNRKTDEFADRLASDLGKILPVSFAFTVTLGVAALLFVQVLYGNLLYASSILIGAFWISVIPTLIVTYYALYYVKSHPNSLAVLWLAALLPLIIGFIYVNNFTLMLSPQRWLELYRRSTAGVSLNWSDPTMIPRYLHMMLGAFAIAGLFVFAAGAWKRSTPYGQWLLSRGSLWFAVPTVLNYGAGMWFVIALPRPVLLGLFGTPIAASLIGLGMLFPLAAVMHAMLAVRTKKTLLHARLAVTTAVLTMVVMVIVRQVVRAECVQPFLRTGDLAVSSQWSVIALFLVLFLAGLGTLYWMLKKTLENPVARAASAD
jgi:hypothetical protein